MGRRRLRLPTSDDDDDDDGEEGEQPLQTLILTRPGASAPPAAPPQPPPPGAPLEISDDDDDEVFADVPDAFSPPSPPLPPPEGSSDGSQLHLGGSSPRASISVDGEGPAGPVDGFLRTLGLRLRREWLDSCLACLSNSHLGFETLDDAGKGKLCFEQFLFSDMNFSGGGLLPENVSGMHGVVLEGPYVLQVDEIVNISSPLRDRYHDAPAGSKRCLKLSLTDGIQRVYGMEYRSIIQLKVFAPAGLKIAIRNVHVRRGLLVLVPEVMEVLGGLVDILEAARERLIYEVNKPPRGKRKQPMLSLSKRASLAAWPSSITTDIEQTYLSMPHNGDVANMIPQANLDTSRSEDRMGSVEGVAGDSHTVGSNLEQSAAVHTRTSGQLAAACTTRTIEDFAGSHTGRGITGDLFVQQAGHTEEFPTQRMRRGSMERLAVRDPLGIINKQSAVQQSGECHIEESTVAHSSVDSEPHVSSNSGVGLGDIDMVDKVEHPLLLNGDREIPFTYLACLLAKWAAEDSVASIQGKIKCFLTGVKGFQFKQRSTYELRVYVDDGSLISEVLVDHHVVEKGVGHSPKEVTAALSSLDKATSSNMREAMKRFQLFLTKFEGTMLVEIRRNQSIPVALEMNEGCSTSDGCLLLGRLKSYTASSAPQQQNLNIIDVSP